MIALYRSGRQSEALAAYRQTSGVLRDELGVDPSPELRDLELAILRHGRALRLPASGPLRTVRTDGTGTVGVDPGATSGTTADAMADSKSCAP